MVDMEYEGFRRLVEPYELRYYVRKGDGVGSEYFSGFDTTGGKSGRVGIKQFLVHKIHAVRETTIPYAARFPLRL